jgi:hypothetical protein
VPEGKIHQSIAVFKGEKMRACSSLRGRHHGKGFSRQQRALAERLWFLPTRDPEDLRVLLPTEGDGDHLTQREGRNETDVVLLHPTFRQRPADNSEFEGSASGRMRPAINEEEVPENFGRATECRGIRDADLATTFLGFGT